MSDEKTMIMRVAATAGKRLGSHMADDEEPCVARVGEKLRRRAETAEGWLRKAEDSQRESARDFALEEADRQWYWFSEILRAATDPRGWEMPGRCFECGLPTAGLSQKCLPCQQEEYASTPLAV